MGVPFAKIKMFLGNRIKCENQNLVLDIFCRDLLRYPNRNSCSQVETQAWD